MQLFMYLMCFWFSQRKEVFLFNDALNTFYLWLYVVVHMVKDYSDGLLFPGKQQGLFLCIIPQTE